MSRFNKKAEKKKLRVFRVRDIFELFKNGTATIKISKKRYKKESCDWSVLVFWDNDKHMYNLEGLTSILDRLVLGANISDVCGIGTITIYI